MISKKNSTYLWIISLIISLVALPFTVTQFEENSLISFILIKGIILFLCFVITFCSICFFGLTSFFPIELIGSHKI